jgi:feruloyl esterase
VQAIYDGASNPQTHKQIWPGFLPGSETFWREVLVGNPNAPGGSSASFFMDGVFNGEANFSYLNINFDSDVALTNNKPAGSGLTWQQALDANNPDLSAFRQHGGKLLMYHGLADPFVSPRGSLDYYTAVIGATSRGPQAVKDTQRFARLFLAPGVTHCGGGPGANVFNGPDNLGGPEDPDHDVFLALRQWVENGVAPTRIIGTKFVNDTPADGVAFTRPMCVYPQLPHYRGVGDPNDASSFVCETNNNSNGPIIADFGTRDTLLGYADLLFFP